MTRQPKLRKSKPKLSRHKVGPTLAQTLALPLGLLSIFLLSRYLREYPQLRPAPAQTVGPTCYLTFPRSPGTIGIGKEVIPDGR